MQTQRFELKYQIPEVVAQAVRRFVRPWLEPDSFGGTADAPAYPVHSLYLDSGDLALYQATVNGDRNRFKLRVRYYDENPAAPVYFEIKRRADRCIHKQRALVRRECAAALLEGEPPAFHHLARPDARNFTALQNFSTLVRRLAAEPRAHVAYEREAWLSSGHNSVRVTMDRAIRCEPARVLSFTTSFARAVPIFSAVVVLEIKFTDRFPNWIGDMVHALGLVQANAAKYVDGVICCGETQFRTRGKVLRRAGEARRSPPLRATVWSSVAAPQPVL